MAWLGAVDALPAHLLRAYAGCHMRALQGRGNGGSNYRGRTFLGCDGNPVTFEVLVNSNRSGVVAC